MFKRIFLLFSLLITFTVFSVMLLTPTVSRADSGCCVLTIPVKITGYVNKAYSFGKATSIKFHSKVSAEACRKAPYKTTVNWRAGNLLSIDTTILESFYTDKSETTCKTLVAAQDSYNGTFCCVTAKSLGSKFTSVGGLFSSDYSKAKAAGNLSCTPVHNRTEKCVSGNLEKKVCNAVPACALSKKAFSKNLDSIELYAKSIAEINKKILAAPIPTLGTQFPGNEKLDKLSICDGAGTTDCSNNSGITYIAIPWIAQLIKWFYSYAIGIGGIVATVMIMIGGFMWILSAGDAGRITVAKGYIKNASLGLILLMTAYMILNFINPDLVNLKPIYIEVPSLTVRQGNFPQCQLDPVKNNMTQIDGLYYCKDFKSKEYVDLTKNRLSNITLRVGASSKYATQKLLDGLKVANAELKRLDAAYIKANKKPAGVYYKLSISGASRAQNSQAKFCNCWQSYKASNYKACPAGCGATRCNLAGKPNCKGKGHSSGQAVDIGLTGPGLDCGYKRMTHNCATRLDRTGKYGVMLAQGGYKCGPNNKIDKNNIYTKCQDELQRILSPNFTGLKVEWWHFTVK